MTKNILNVNPSVRGLVIVIVNEQHSILPDQERVLDELFPKSPCRGGGVGEHETWCGCPDFKGHRGWRTLKVPAAGWSLAEMSEIRPQLTKHAKTVIFISPIPALLSQLSALAGWQLALDSHAEQLPFPSTPAIQVGVFHNDRRVAKELPGGKLVHTVAPDGWEIVWSI